MPPVRTAVAGRFAQLNTRTRDNLKPYEEPYVPRVVRHNDEKKSVPFHEDYMNIDEFSNTAMKTEERNDEDKRQFMTEDKDYPKPRVDLIASLRTLEQMIRDQKMLIKREDTQRASLTSNNTVTTSAVTTETIVAGTISSNSESENGTALEGTLVKPSVQMKTSVYTEAPFENNSSSSDIEPSSPSNHAESPPSSPSSGEVTKRSAIPDERPNEVKDVDYWERRKRNNLAARKSREDRRKKEIEALKTTKDLAKENSYLTALLNRLTSRNEQLESKLQDIRAEGGRSSHSMTSSDS